MELICFKKEKNDKKSLLHLSTQCIRNFGERGLQGATNMQNICKIHIDKIKSSQQELH